MNDTDYNGMSSIERWYWTLIALMIAVILVHIFPYLRYVWTDVTRLQYWLMFCQAALFAFVVPAWWLLDLPICLEAGHSSSCQSAEDAGIDSFVLVFLPTFVMWGFDTLGCLAIGLIKGRDPSTSGASVNTRCSIFCRQIPSVMFPRFGLTHVYCGLIWFAGSLRTRIELEQLIRSEDMDTDAKLVYLERQEIAGIVSFALAAVLWSVGFAKGLDNH
mmetsp:Transcript_32400/g.59442  ORF Transcript_32400/g.59442 Transcript_32400/m.59442 type:complete len:217 (-) Transcript_32400:233-883(-)